MSTLTPAAFVLAVSLVGGAPMTATTAMGSPSVATPVQRLASTPSGKRIELAIWIAVAVMAVACTIVDRRK